MFAPYADRPPDLDGPIVPWLYGIQEFFSIRELVAEIKEVFGIEVKMPEEELDN